MKNLLSALCVLSGFLSETQAQEPNWQEVRKIAAPERNDLNYFGESVSISGDYAIVGSPGYDIKLSDLFEIPEAGAAHIFKRDGNGGWVHLQKIMASDSTDVSAAFFGTSVSVNGNYAVVGAMGHEGEGGTVYIFKKDDSGMWKEVQKFRSPDRSQSKKFGKSVSVSGIYAMVGDPETTSGIRTGSVDIYQRLSSGKWIFLQRSAPDFWSDDPDPRFGTSVSVSGNYAFVGAATEAFNSGAVYVLKKDGDYWSVAQKLIPSDLDEFYSYEFGTSVSISGNYAVVGTARHHQVYVFEFQSNGSWKEVQTIRPSAPIPSIRNGFGASVSINGDYAIVGAAADTNDASGTHSLKNAGSAFIFKRDDNGTWKEMQRILPSDRNAEDMFGASVAIDGGHALVGVRLDDHNAFGEDSLKDAGSAYIFELSSTTGVVRNEFGCAVSFHPNPVDGNFQIDLDGLHSEVDITIRDAVGHAIFERKYMATDAITIDFDAPPGIYLALIRMKDGRSSTLKILKR